MKREILYPPLPSSAHCGPKIREFVPGGNIPRVETKKRECWKFLDSRLNSENDSRVHGQPSLGLVLSRAPRDRCKREEKGMPGIHPSRGLIFLKGVQKLSHRFMIFTLSFPQDSIVNT